MDAITKILIRMWFVSTAGVGGRSYYPPTSVRCALLRKPTKGSDCNGMHGGLSTKAYRGSSSCKRSAPEQVGTTKTAIDFSLANLA